MIAAPPPLRFTRKWAAPFGQPPPVVPSTSSPVPDILDRIKETTTSSGAGSPITLLGAVTDFVSFSVGGDNCGYTYCVDDGSGNWEVRYGVYNQAAATLSCQALLSNSAGSRSAGYSFLNFGAGTKNVFCVDPAAILTPRNTTYNVKMFGAKGDVLTVRDGTITSGQAILTSASGLFTPADAGKTIGIQGAGTAGNSNGVANWLITTILSYQSPNQVTLNANATSTVSAALMYWGTLDSSAINAATLSASINGGVVYFPPGTYFINSSVTWYTHTHLRGAGIDTTVLMLAPGATCDIIKSYGFDQLTGSNKAAGITACSIRDLSIDGRMSHGGYVHTTNSTTAILPTDTTITVDSTANFPGSGVLLVFGDGANPAEVISYTGKTPTTFTGCARAQENTFSNSGAVGISIDLRSAGGIRSSGSGIRVYGYGYVISNVTIHDCEHDGLYSEWTTLSTSIDPDGYQSYINNVKVHDCNGNGVWWTGPHDSTLTNVNPYANAMHGVRVSGASNGTRFAQCHSAGKQNWAWSLEAFSQLFNCTGEQALSGQVYVGAPQTLVIGCRFFTDETSALRGIVFPAGVPNISFCIIDAIVVGCDAGSIDLSGDAGNNYIRLQVKQQKPGNVIIGTANVSTVLALTIAPGNFNALSGFQTQTPGPAFIRSQQATSPALTLRVPSSQSVNILEAQNSAGTALTVVDKNGMIGNNQPAPTFGYEQRGGSHKLTALTTPSAPTVTPFGGSATTATYFVVAKDAAGNKTLVSASGQTTTGAAALTSVNYNRVTWTAPSVPGFSYDVLKTDTATLLGTVQPLSGGKVTRITVGAGGSGYTGGAPPIGFSGPANNGLVATSTVSGGQLTSITMAVNGFGTGFTSVPTVVIGEPGNGATAVANMGVSNYSSIANGGTLYQVGDTVTETGGTFATATVYIVTAVSAGGVVTALAVQTPGSYSVIPSNPVAQGSTSGVGSGLTVNALWGVMSCTVTNGGTGYTSAPAIGFNGGGFYPTCGVNLVSNAVAAVSVNGGSGGLTGVPTVVVGGVAAGSGCTCTASIAALCLDDIGQSTSAYTNPTRNATADITADGNVTATAAPAILVGNMGVTTTAVSSTTTAETKSLIGTIVGTFTCPANFLIVGRRIRFKGHGNITTGATASTIDFQVFFAGTKIASTGALAPTISQSNRYWEFEVEFVCVTVGSSGTVFAQGVVRVQNAAAPVAFTDWPILGNNATPPAAVTVDTTASSLIDFKSVTGNNLHTITLNPGSSLEVMN